MTTLKFNILHGMHFNASDSLSEASCEVLGVLRRFSDYLACMQASGAPKALGAFEVSSA